MNPKEQLLASLHDLLVEDLITKFNEGTITPAEMRVAMSLLVHNDITAEDLEVLTDKVVAFNEDDLEGLDIKSLKISNG